MKVLIEYNEVTGQMTDVDGIQVGTWMNINSFELNSGVSVEVLIKLKNAGYTADEIIQMKNKEII